MLVLTRKKNDSIVIDGRILVEVLQIKGNGIRLGISAPPDVSILRGELKPFGVAGADEPPHPRQTENVMTQQTLALFPEHTDQNANEAEPKGGSRRPLRPTGAQRPLPSSPRLPRSDRPWRMS